MTIAALCLYLPFAVCLDLAVRKAALLYIPCLALVFLLGQEFAFIKGNMLVKAIVCLLIILGILVSINLNPFWLAAFAAVGLAIYLKGRKDYWSWGKAIPGLLDRHEEKGPDHCQSLRSGPHGYPGRTERRA